MDHFLETVKAPATLLGSLLSTLSSNANERGAQFERDVCEWFLRNDPRYRERFERIIPYREWEHGTADLGTDLIAVEHDDSVWAIQAKCFDERYQITKADIDSFLSDSNRPEIAVRLLLATTDKLNSNARRTLEQQDKRTEWLLRSQLEDANVAWPASYEALRRELRGPAKRAKRPTPRPDQREAIKDVSAGLRHGTPENPRRGQLIMACGTGKTLTAHWIVERLESRRTICFVPSISLLNQTMGVWLGNERRTGVAYLPVCSDSTVWKDKDSSEDMRPQELGVPVSTKPEEIADFLRRHPGDVIVFATYQSSPKVAEVLALVDSDAGFDLVVADEAHRCAGTADSIYATVLDDTKIPCPRRLFMTATPRYFSERDREGEIEIASMDDKTAFGNELYRLSFRNAIELGILADYQVVVIGVTDTEAQELVDRGSFVLHEGRQTDARSLAAELGVIKAMTKYDLRRVISFHRTRAAARAFQHDLDALLGRGDYPGELRPEERFPEQLWSAFVDGQDTSEKRNRLLKQLGAPGMARKLLSNARCLTEGVDVPTIDGVVFVDPKGSRIDIIQAVGRAIRRADGKEVGTIVIPIVVETEADPVQKLKASAFKPVWDVLVALRAHDDQLAQDLDELRRELGHGRTVADRTPAKIKLDVPQTVVGHAFRRALETRLVEATTASWEFWYGLLERYVAEHGDARVPQNHVTGKGFRLGAWVGQQRQVTPSPERRARLDHLGFVWDSNVDDWERGYAALEAYVAEHCHARVPKSHISGDGFRLGAWVANQRIRDPGAERRVRLDELGFVWTARTDDWERGYAALQAYVAEHGHAHVPQNYVTGNGFRLGIWVAIQRRGEPRPDRQVRLDGLGFVWDILADSWEQGYAALAAFVAEHGHARVPVECVTCDGYRLGQWARVQRRTDPSPERRARLDELGFIWAPFANDWEQGYAALKAFVDEHGHALVPTKHATDDGFRLGMWVFGQRQRHPSPERQARLDELGFVWDPLADGWEQGYAALAAYVAEHGHARVPPKHVTGDGYPLGRWVFKQRQCDPGTERRTRLDALGFVWAPRAADWERGYAALTAYVNEHGHARVPKEHVTGDGFRLGGWVSTQRRGDTSAERRARLDELGFAWDHRARARDLSTPHRSTASST